MPIKLPKLSARRKSSGNILDEVESAPQPSFRVFERPGGPVRSMTDGVPLTKRMSEGNLVTVNLDDSDNIFADRALDKHHRYDRSRPMDYLRKRLTRRRDSAQTYESSTSTRLSSSSTLPSSTEIHPADDVLASPHSRHHDIPVPPQLSGALRAAGRTFSFGGRFSKSSTSSVQPQQQAMPDTSNSHRTMTSRTDNTATPPKLPDANFEFGGDDNDFHNMFDTLGKRISAVMRKPSPQPINTDRSTAVEPAPYSWASQYPEDAPDAEQNESLLARKPLPTPPASDAPTGMRRASPSPAQMLATTSHRSLDRLARQSDQGLRRSGAYPERRESDEHIDDEDAKLVRQSLLWTKENAFSADTDEAPVDKGKGISPSDHLSPDGDTMFADRRSPAPTKSFDSSIEDQARLAVQFAESLPQRTSPGNKVMTPSQFEHYRKQQELRRSRSDASKSDDESVNDEYDEEDEAEKQREAERQRRKQEAHLSVYRQQMMKVTGQMAAEPTLRPEMSGARSSTPNLMPPLFNPVDKSISGKSSEDDDEEVPLGILAAHGFPSRNRPPTRLTSAGSNPNLRASMQPSYISSASSVTGAELDMGKRNSTLPVFARNLPRDPYFGAGLVNPSNRESLAMGGGSVYGGSQSPMPPPGGLVGVIANEERARATRRGSPNTQAMYNMGDVPRPYSMLPQPPNMSTNEQQAQIELSQQMQQMMQMQMQWMQQMMQMQGYQGPPMPLPPMMMKGGMPTPPAWGAGPMPGAPMGPPSMMGGMPPPPSMSGANPNMRPMSVAPGSIAPGASSQFDQRTLSMLDPNISARHTGSLMPPHSNNTFRPNTATGGYAPSIAPSERSNAGMASRYRPVSVMQGGGWQDENNPSKTMTMPSQQSRPQIPKSTSLATITIRPVSTDRLSATGGKKGHGGSDDDDDDEAWAEMMKKRDKKKSSWKMKRATSSLGDLLSAVH
ncbi:hypothetical protein N7510_005871 [Penicillium lagena]|uniref:uncharacterized protein n=1 Tax=Penicillium lagena TaxID=94218 RepID=UPI00253F710D|nr:uncharacterized protein N7510_005871 [Penicillium lagena]KAJ5612677.1 hypothetical protein N7510_005871 [Penicillium lagena]